jgi:hypothetical protein
MQRTFVECLFLFLCPSIPNLHSPVTSSAAAMGNTGSGGRALVRRATSRFIRPADHNSWFGPLPDHMVNEVSSSLFFTHCIRHHYHHHHHHRHRHFHHYHLTS